jgi:hypothetical protein
MPDPIRQCLPEALGQVGILKHQRALHVAVAVKARREPEVAIEQRTGLAKEIEDGL